MTDRSTDRSTDPDPDLTPGLSAPDAERLADVMFALAAPSRLQILACLHAGPLSVTEIVARVAMEQSAVSHQLRVLREHEVVSVERRGRHRLYALRSDAVREVLVAARRHLETLDAPARASRPRRAAPGR